MPDVDKELVHNACFSADEVAMGFEGTGAERTRAVIERALEALIANGLITMTPKKDWPEYYVPFPPYRPPWEDPNG